MASSLEARLQVYAAIERETLEFKRAVMAVNPWLPDHPRLAAWRAQSKIFAVPWDGKNVYSIFQFDEKQQPLPIIGELLKVLRRDPKRSDWENLAWFVGANGWLGGPSPHECLSDLERVLHAEDMAVVLREYR